MKNSYEIVDGVGVIHINSPTYGPKITLVSVDKIPLLEKSSIRWYVWKSKTGQFYAVGTNLSPSVKRNQRRISLHRFLTDAPKGMLVDHKNRDTLDNQDDNLRIGTKSLNAQNLSKMSRTSKTEPRGVTLHRESGKYRATMIVNGERFYFGAYRTVEEADYVVSLARSIMMPFSDDYQQDDISESTLCFKYGTMGSGKTYQLLKLASIYRVLGRRVLLLTPEIDNRGQQGKITSRSGDFLDAISISKEANLSPLVDAEMPDIILIDESQFLTKSMIQQLADIVDMHGIRVICYGLKNDSRNELFEGSYHLLVQADRVEEIVTSCAYCDNDAHMVVRLNEHGQADYGGPQIKIGFDYKPVCRVHYNHPL